MTKNEQNSTLTFKEEEHRGEGYMRIGKQRGNSCIHRRGTGQGKKQGKLAEVNKIGLHVDATTFSCSACNISLSKKTW